MAQEVEPVTDKLREENVLGTNTRKMTLSLFFFFFQLKFSAKITIKNGLNLWQHGCVSQEEKSG